jgi:hypothetical protein
MPSQRPHFPRWEHLPDGTLPRTLPGPKNADEFTIGVFGGSVAGMLADAWSKNWAQWAGSVELSSLVGRPLRILNLTILSGNEPGQYNEPACQFCFARALPPARFSL